MIDEITLIPKNPILVPERRKTAPAVKPRPVDVDKIPETVDQGKPSGMVRGLPPFPIGVDVPYTRPIPPRPIVKKPGQTAIIGK